MGRQYQQIILTSGTFTKLLRDVCDAVVVGEEP